MSIISVIMPVYNCQRFIADSIESILGQTLKDFEFVIVNDGSTDNTEDIIKSYLTDSRIRYYKFQCHQGYAQTCNKAVELAQCEFIAMQDSDDVSFSSRLEEESEVLINNPDVEMVYSPVLFINIAGEIIGRWGGTGCQFSKDETFYKLYIEGDFIPNPTVMMRRRHITNNKLYNSELSFCCDYEHKLRLLHDYPVIEINHPLVKMRRDMRHETMTSNRQENFLAERKILKIAYDRYRNNHLRVHRLDYRKALSNQMLKESHYYAQKRNIGKSLVLLFKACGLYPVHRHDYIRILLEIAAKKKNINC
ncbi:MAG: glycosyltransferase [Sedimentisphaerales bacterium]|nr:glycosyltransferase [Sedimentisphaerales bacterium]